MWLCAISIYEKFLILLIYYTRFYYYDVLSLQRCSATPSLWRCVRHLV